MAIEGSNIVGHVAFSPITAGASSDVSYSDGSEARIIAGLRDAADQAIRIPDQAHTTRRKGIGIALITEGLWLLRARGAKGRALVGDPDYYGRFGFRSDGRVSYKQLPSQYVRWLLFGDEAPSGRLRFSPAFER